MRRVLVIGASRGLGLEFARQYGAAGWETSATYRKPPPPVLEGVEWQRLDATEPDDCAALATAWRDRALDLLVLNAAATDRPSVLGSLDYGAWEHVLRTNTIAPIRVAEAMRPALARAGSAWVVALSSELASPALMRRDSASWSSRGAYYAYRTSKAALNVAMRLLAIELQSDGVGTIAIDPGWAQTDLGGADAPFSAADVVHRVRDLIGRLKPEQSGGFFRADGSAIPT